MGEGATAAPAAPLVSVVMPTYGVASYIGEAVRAVQAQTFADWELVVVNDASPDASAAIARRLAARDARIRVVNHEINRGLAAARNTGLAAARGTWVWFPDPDDTYEPDLLAVAVAAARQGEPDAVLFGHAEVFYDAHGAFLYANERPLEPGIYITPDAWHGLVAGLERDTHYGYAWNKLYRLDRIRTLGLTFEHVRLIEDIAFNVAYLDDACAITICGGTPYRYAKRAGRSLTNANAYGASEYWALHERRVTLLRDQLAGWGVLAGGAPTLGSLYVRYVVSTLERSYHAAEHWDTARRRTWLADLASTPLYGELVPVAEAREGRVLSAAITALRRGRYGELIAIARAAHLARTHAYGLFTRVRSTR